MYSVCTWVFAYIGILRYYHILTLPCYHVLYKIYIVKCLAHDWETQIQIFQISMCFRRNEFSWMLFYPHIKPLRLGKSRTMNMLIEEFNLGTWNLKSFAVFQFKLYSQHQIWHLHYKLNHFSPYWWIFCLTYFHSALAIQLSLYGM